MRTTFLRVDQQTPDITSLSCQVWMLAHGQGQSSLLDFFVYTSGRMLSNKSCIALGAFKSLPACWENTKDRDIGSCRAVPQACLPCSLLEARRPLSCYKVEILVLRKIAPLALPPPGCYAADPRILRSTRMLLWEGRWAGKPKKGHAGLSRAGFCERGQEHLRCGS
jgi:hypothetical protein